MKILNLEHLHMFWIGMYWGASGSQDICMVYMSTYEEHIFHWEGNIKLFSDYNFDRGAQNCSMYFY